MRKRLLLLMLLGLTACGSNTPPKAGIATAHPIATAAGHTVLSQGGNAFDAAIAVTATLAVVEPYSSGIGGGGFWLLHRAEDGHQVMIDGREKAPLKAHRDMYLDTKGDVVPGLSMDGPLAAGIPGVPAAMVHMAERYGQLPLAQSLAPAIDAAREGFKVTEYYRRLAAFRLDALRASASAAAVFLKDGEVPPLGHVIRQPDLAETLMAIADKGRDGFYRGRVAVAMVDGSRSSGGIWSLEDLAAYEVVERQPLVGEYRGYKVTTVPPPSSGGVALLTMLNSLSLYELETMDRETRTHLIVEAMRRAYRDRAEFLGDSDFVEVPVQRLISLAHAQALSRNIDLNEATDSRSLKPAAVEAEGPHTTHFSILDREGNRVAATLSINYPFGSGFVPTGTGVLLNDEMDDFSAKPGVPNAYGLVGAEANAIAPGKRPLSSMSPSFVENGQRVAILGTPGGSRIITMVLLGMLDVVAGERPEHWVGLKRFHHQYLPDVIQYEEGAFDNALIDGLQLRGHHLQPIEHGFGNMQAVLWERDSGKVLAASDPRVEGLAEVR